MHPMEINSPQKWAVKKKKTTEVKPKELTVIEYSNEVDFIHEKLHSATEAGPTSM